MRKYFDYLKYFLYLGWNWNFRLAFFVLRFEIAGEKKYSVTTTGIDDLETSVIQKDRVHASIYQPVNFFIAEWLFNHISLEEKSTGRFLDAGCGRGRAMAMAAWHGFTLISGFDISPKLCHEAIKIIENIQEKYPKAIFEVEHSDARFFTVPDDTKIIFMFNPFDKVIMKAFMKKVKASLARNPRTIKILYANPECRNILEKEGFSTIDSIRKLKWLQGMVLVNKTQ